MTGSDIKRKIADRLKKGKYVLAVIVLGLILILWPQNKQTQTADSQQTQDEFSLEQEEEKISRALSEIEGAGEVSVVLTLDVSTRNVLAEDTQTSS